MNQKIIIFGFPHCGTTILKSIIGHIEDVYEIYKETKLINISTTKQFILCKYPFTLDEFFDEKYKDYIKIFIIRNPLFVFSSLNKRFEYNIPSDHCFDRYVDTITKFIKYSNKNSVYTIKYEDMFDNNFQELKQILDNIGMKYDYNIFDNTLYTNIAIDDVKINNNIHNIKKTNKIINNVDHGLYRTWQINQPFVFKNDVSNLDLTKIQKQQIVNNPYVLQLYPDIQSYN